MNKARKRMSSNYGSGENIQVMYKRGGKNIGDVTTLIRSIQRTEGNPDCFRREGKDSCDRNECAWRLYCMQG